jgi:hypothetical protein
MEWFSNLKDLEEWSSRSFSMGHGLKELSLGLKSSVNCLTGEWHGGPPLWHLGPGPDKRWPSGPKKR